MAELQQKRSAAPDAASQRDDAATPGSKRPTVLTLGALLVFLRAAGGVIWTVSFILNWHHVAKTYDLDNELGAVLFTIVCVTEAIWLVVLVLLAWLVLRGSTVARMLVMVGSTIGISVAAFDYFTAGQEITMRTTLLTLTLDILLLLALSSRDTRAWTRGRKRARQLPRRKA
ncbi:hypothetical protein JOF28_001769 [Leucobacter exalbidus]|uniref:Uncharacterized protein n=1 Tax=Leucobacter exalbidus TaxID=662960 RepID=A0A940T3U7_9MICO|nr:hypothetical protein [Leucobacter exalbidus]MBP1326537.1 hypothetical protein [Leucobacter exalbidus]